MSRTIPNQRTIPELIAKYSLNGNIRDIYVEGISDRYLVNWFFTKIGRSDVVVYQIDIIDIPEDILDKYKLNKNCNRSKLIALAKELSAKIKHKNVLFIIDKDFNGILFNEDLNSYIKHTDYSSMEMYLFCTELFDKFIQLVLHGLIFNTEQIISFCSNVLTRLFLVRLANYSLQWNLTKVSAWPDVEISNTNCVFDENRYIDRYLQKNAKFHKKKDFLDTIVMLEPKLPVDVKNCMHGHDFIEFLCEIVKKLKKSRRGLCEPETMASSLCGCLEITQLVDEPLFKSLCQF